MLWYLEQRSLCYCTRVFYIDDSASVPINTEELVALVAATMLDLLIGRCGPMIKNNVIRKVIRRKVVRRKATEH